MDGVSSETLARNVLFEESLCLHLVVVVHELQVHVDEERVEDLGQLSSVTIENRLDKLLQAAIVDLV